MLLRTPLTVLAIALSFFLYDILYIYSLSLGAPVLTLFLVGMWPIFAVAFSALPAFRHWARVDVPQ
jgi:drug/metabolite transporter (DMT)-like permease